MGGEAVLVESQEAPTRWDALKQIMLYREKRRSLGSAWQLYLYLCFQVDPGNRLVTNYPKLSEDLGEPMGTIKKWKERLIREQVISSQKTKHGFVVSVLKPYDTPVTAMKDDLVELRLRSDHKTRNLLKTALGSDSGALLTIIADLARKVEALEKRGNL